MLPLAMLGFQRYKDTEGERAATLQALPEHPTAWIGYKK